MRKPIIFISLFSSINAFACSEALRPYSDECKAQERYQKISSEFNQLAINATELKGFKIPKAVGKSNYFSGKNELLNQSESTLAKNKEWQTWNNGQKFINSLNSTMLDFSEITKLHKTLFAGKSFFSTPGDVGKLRTGSAEVNPKILLTCSDKILNDGTFLVLADYDLKSAEGYPLLVLSNIKECDDKKFSSGELMFYKGASVKVELSRWLADLNDMIYRYESETAPSEYGPYKYLSDMRRWFLAIKPFSTGNEEVVAALVDYTVKRLHLAPISLSDQSSPVLRSAEKNLELTLLRVKESLDFFEGCLYETKMKLVSSECSTL